MVPKPKYTRLSMATPLSRNKKGIRLKMLSMLSILTLASLIAVVKTQAFTA